MAGRRKPVHLITDRAKRYRAQKAVEGPRRCILCGTTPGRLDVMHLDGDESNGERIGAGVRTRQYNPSAREKYEKAEAERRALYAQLRGRDLTSAWARPRLRKIYKLDQLVEKLSTQAAYEDAGQGKLFNPASGHVPTFQQYAWGVSSHERGAHDEGGTIIHATPRGKRIEYARRIADIKTARRGEAPF